MYLTEWLIFKTKSTIIWKQATGYSVAWYFIDLGYKLSQLFSKRDILSALKKAGIIKVPRGTGGAELCVDPSQITLFNIYSALEPDGVTSIIEIHPCDDRPCPIAQNIRKVLKTPYHKIEDAVIETMKEITLQSIIDDFHDTIH